MKKFKEMIACGLMSLMFVGMFYIGIQINSGEMTRPQGALIMIISFIAVIVICTALTKEDKK